MRTYIARSVLAAFLLEMAQAREPGRIRHNTRTGCDWRAARIERGSVTQLVAQAAVGEVVRGNTAWVMVEDADPKDGQQVPSSDDGEPSIRPSTRAA